MANTLNKKWSKKCYIKFCRIWRKCRLFPWSNYGMLVIIACVAIALPCIIILAIVQNIYAKILLVVTVVYIQILTMLVHRI
jgi:hypothetical protein